MKIAVGISCYVACFVFQNAFGWPVVVPAHRLSGVAGSLVSDWRAYACVGSELRRAPVQVQTRGGNGLIEFASLRDGILTDRSQLVVDTRWFAGTDEKKNCSLALLCNETNPVKPNKIKLDVTGEELHFVKCSGFDTKQEDIGKQAILRDRTITTDGLSYQYSSKNALLLDSFSVLENNTMRQFLSAGEMHLYGKPRYFIPLHFTGSDVRSEVIGSQMGIVASVIELSFFLQILLFKISLNLTSQVTFYDDAIHIPMMLTIPMAGSSLRAGSGLFYGFKSKLFANETLPETFASNLPFLGRDVPTFKSVNTFSLNTDATALAVGIRNPPEFEKMKFVPQFAWPSELKKQKYPKTKSDFGIYYDVGSIEKGFYTFDIWLFAGKMRDKNLIQFYAENGIGYRIL